MTPAPFFFDSGSGEIGDESANEDDEEHPEEDIPCSTPAAVANGRINPMTGSVECGLMPWFGVERIASVRLVPADAPPDKQRFYCRCQLHSNCTIVGKYAGDEQILEWSSVAPSRQMAPAMTYASFTLGSTKRSGT